MPSCLISEQILYYFMKVYSVELRWNDGPGESLFWTSWTGGTVAINQLWREFGTWQLWLIKFGTGTLIIVSSHESLSGAELWIRCAHVVYYCTLLKMEYHRPVTCSVSTRSFNIETCLFVVAMEKCYLSILCLDLQHKKESYGFWMTWQGMNKWQNWTLGTKQLTLFLISCYD